MSDHDAPPLTDANRLGSALAWCKLRLERAAHGPSDELEQALASAEGAMIASSWGPPSPLEVLAERFGLSKFEHDVLLLCLAMEVDTTIAPLCARAQRDPRKTSPSFALALSTFDEPSWDAISPERPLRFWHLVELDTADPGTLTSRALRLDERILAFVKGVHHVDSRWLSLLEPLDGTRLGGEVPPSHRQIVDALLRRLDSWKDNDTLPAVQLVGRDARSARLIATCVEHELRSRAYRLNAEHLPTGSGDLDLLLRLWEREVTLGPVALYVDAHNVPDSHNAALERFIARAPGIVLTGTREPRGAGDRHCAVIEVNKPTPAERYAIWLSRLGVEHTDVAARLSGQFELDTVSIANLASNAPRDPSGDIDGDGLWQSCVDATAPRAEGLARRIMGRATWDDLVLPPPQLAMLREVAAQVQHRTKVHDTWGFGARTSRGLALTALFWGESGTGKTLAAEVLAAELKLQLLFIDLSSVVSKYIGETEKNLRRVFDGAEDSGAILFIDEADALFGKRSEVKDSHDRYANVEVSYLLQRMEAYRGLAILATNMKSSLDPAFVRRLRFFVKFTFPGEVERRAIWRRVFPPEAPLGQLDFERLASFNLTGGIIRNVALNAAFLAAHANTPITMPLVLSAIRTELHKLERRVSEAEFRWNGETEALR